MAVITIPEELLALRDSLNAFLEREVAPVEERYADELRRTGTIEPQAQITARRELRRKSVEAGFYAMAMPEEIGGMGVGALGMALCHEAVAASGLLLAERGGVLPNVEGPTPALLALDAAQRKEYLEPLMRAEREACFALTEPEAGSDATRMRTRAEKDGEHWVINGRKHFITHGQYADFIELLAVTDPERGAAGGITFFLVDSDIEGVSVTNIQHTLGEDRPAELTFEDVRVHESKVVGEVGYGFQTAMGWINAGRINIGAGALGKAQHLLDRMTEYARQRVAFGQPIGSYQFVQQHVVDSLMEVRMARNLLYECADAVDRGDDARQAAAMAKLAATETVARVADRAIQVHGGSGVMTELGIERFYRDVRAMRLYEGTSEILRGTIAKTLRLGG
jgi:acyl-CoA dehydrogenase